MKYFMSAILLNFVWLNFAIAESNTVTQQEANIFKPTLEVTKDWRKNQQKQLKTHQTSLKKLRKSSPKFQKKIQTQLSDITEATTFNDEDVKQAIEQRQTINHQLNDYLLERQQVRKDIEERTTYIETLQAKLTELQALSEEQITEAQKPLLESIPDEIQAQQQANALNQKLLDTLTPHIELRLKETLLAVDWFIKVYELNQLMLIKERGQLVAEAETALTQERDYMKKAKEEMPDKLKQLKSSDITADALGKMLEEAGLERDSTEVDFNNFKLELESNQAHLEREQQYVTDETLQLEILRKTPPDEPELQAFQDKRVVAKENKVKFLQQIIDLQTQNMEVIKGKIEVKEKYLATTVEWYGKLESLYHEKQKQELEQKMQADQQQHINDATELRWQLSKLSATEENAAQRQLLEIKIQQANELAQHVVNQLKLRHIKDQLEQWQLLVDEPPPTEFSPNWLENLQNRMEELRVLLVDTNKLRELWYNKVEVLSKQRMILDKRTENAPAADAAFNKEAKAILDKLEQTIKQAEAKLPELQAHGDKLLEAFESAYKENMTKALLRLRKLPSNQAEWLSIYEEVIEIPKHFFQQVKISWNGLAQAFYSQTKQQWMKIAGVIAGWLVLLLIIRVIYTRSKLKPADSTSFLGFSFLLFFQLIHVNFLTFAIVGALLLGAWVVQPSYISVLLPLMFIISLVGMQLAISFVWLILSNLDFKPENRRKVFKQLSWIIFFISIVALISALVHTEYEGYALSFSLSMRDLIDSVVMLLLGLLLFPLLQIRQIVLYFMQRTKRTYWMWVVNLVMTLLQVFVLTVSIMGIIGYISLGWTVAHQVSWFMLVLTGWLIVQGLADDFIQFLKASISQRSQPQLAELWAEDIIPLIQKITMFILIGLAIVVLFWLTGWSSDVAVRDNISKIFNYPLISLGKEGDAVRVINIIMAVVVVWAVFWFGSWSHRLSYRWIFAGITDSGIRHSLSVFVQYIVILIGFFITLKVMGIDPTALTVFAGALGVGIGFGMQNIVNNFLSGILLLVERPLRTGDYVTLGGNHGTVRRIGIRSMTMGTDDGKEVIVPNANLISGAFTNWTRDNQIIQSQLNFGIGFDDNPHTAEQIVRDILDNQEGVLQEPAYEIYLTEFTDYKMNFRVEYFVDWQQANCLAVQSQLYIKIWDRFRVAGIRMPFPQREIHSPEQKSQHFLQPKIL
ncbi:mechanosensitive ion channel domain-containing protein [Candidatus Albibeggiatoa sp. nov. NOAA]|uniref:mechanosensitive ion channel domain-containing protein n=1 Tax=Candidatus Albibeggiatoa sp. nov. NOAA TaxID=3162724 RepID=UPI003304581A|nr:mechanosensitive ion channel [Thiotrichaceae bacterium]